MDNQYGIVLMNKYVFRVGDSNNNEHGFHDNSQDDFRENRFQYCLIY